MGKLRTKVARGVVWVLLEKFGIQTVHFVVALVLARLLGPKDYGTVALLTVFVEISNIFIDCGFGRALVQKKEARQVDYNTVFYLSLCVAAFLYVVLFLTAPFVAAFYKMPELGPMLRVLAITLIFHSVNGVQNVELNRKMLFKLSFRISWVRVGVSAVVGIVLAFCGWGPWALVWATCLGGFAGMIARQLVIRWRPTWTFSWVSARELFTFGWKTTLAKILAKLHGNLFVLLVGKLHSRADLAFMKKGTHLVSPLEGAVDSAINRVSFPALAKMQGDVMRMRGAVRRMLASSSFLVLPAMACAMVVSDYAVEFLLGSKWASCAPYMRMACVACVFKSIDAVNLQPILAQGRSDAYLFLSLFRRVFGVTVLLLTIRYGVYAVVFASTYVVWPVCLLVNTLPNRRFLGYSAGSLFVDLLPALGLAIGVAVMTWGAVWLVPVHCGVRLAVGVFIGGAAFVLLALVFRMRTMADLVGQLRKILAKRCTALVPLADFIIRRCAHDDA